MSSVLYSVKVEFKTWRYIRRLVRTVCFRCPCYNQGLRRVYASAVSAWVMPPERRAFLVTLRYERYHVPLPFWVVKSPYWTSGPVPITGLIGSTLGS